MKRFFSSLVFITAFVQVNACIFGALINQLGREFAAAPTHGASGEFAVVTFFVTGFVAFSMLLIGRILFAYAISSSFSNHES